MASKALIQAVAVTSELCGRTFSPEAAAVFVDDLARYPEDQILPALARCRKEVRGVLTVQDVLSRIEDGRPGPEEAWGMIPKDEAGSVVWTHEMRMAMQVASGLLNDGDAIAARMAFKERYAKLVQQARDAGAPVHWEPSLGHDPYQRESVVLEAVAQGKLTQAHAQQLLPYRELEVAPAAAQLLGPVVKRLLAT